MRLVYWIEPCVKAVLYHVNVLLTLLVIFSSQIGYKAFLSHHCNISLYMGLSWPRIIENTDISRGNMSLPNLLTYRVFLFLYDVGEILSSAAIIGRLEPKSWMIGDSFDGINHINLQSFRHHFHWHSCKGPNPYSQALYMCSIIDTNGPDGGRESTILKTLQTSCCWINMNWCQFQTFWHKNWESRRNKAPEDVN